MLQTLLSSLKAGASNDRDLMNRRHPRRDVDRCVVMIHGRTFPVENWSLGGMLLDADERLFGLQQDIDLTVKFKLRNTILDINHKATVVRKSNGKVALQFEVLTQTIARQFQQVIDDYVAGQFASSQA
ncbi:MAG: PilZ domain-containing protein [Rhodospirillales bacterium]|nr:PilZ domain-containing protein [Rhodospirillales bacterium]